MGEAYLLNVRTGQTWTDWYITCGPGKTTFVQAPGLPWLLVTQELPRCDRITEPRAHGANQVLPEPEGDARAVR